MSIPLKVLIVEDSEDDAALLELELKRGGYHPESTRVDTPKTMSSQLNQKEWDVVISDYVMPKFSGSKALEIFKKSGLDVPFIVVSGKIGEDTAVEAMKAGAHDYIMKDRLGRLVPAIKRELKEAQVRRDRRFAEKALKESEEKYRLVVENAGEAITVMQEGMLRYVNPKMTEISGYSQKQLTSKPFIDFVHAEDKDQFAKQQKKRLRSKTNPHTYEFRILGKDGIIRWLENIGVTIQWEGKPASLNFLSDITRRKENEEEIKQATEQLKIEREALENKNIALREILNQIDAEKNAIKKQITSNVEQAIIPTVLRLKELSPPTQAKSFEMLERDLKEIVSPFVETIKSKYTKLSPRELEICRLIKNGMTSKEIAEALNLALATVHKYRELIRRKLEITNSETNLNTYLQSI
ncbi:MAG: PAS domain S-box protein [Candidatus Thorarchaeota archaeon]